MPNTYTDLELLRKIIADPHKNGYDEVLTDGESTDFQLSHFPVVEDSESVVLDGASQSNTTDYTVDYEQGILTIVDAPNPEKVLSVKYRYSVFSDEELLVFLDLEGSVDSAAVQCFEILLSDAARRFDYSAGQTDMKPSQIFDHLQQLLAYYKNKVGGAIQVPVLSRRNNRYYNPNNRNEYIGQESEVNEGDITRNDL